MRRLVATVFMLFVFAQAFAAGVQGKAFAHGDTEEAEHTLMHWEGVTHHHDARGAPHQDNSDESIEHILADIASGAAVVLLPAPLASFSPERAPPPRATSDASGPSAYPDGLRRPPRLLA